MSRKFTKINESFDCINCGKKVPPSSSTCRNHCPFCLHSLHVDEFPGDRANPCKGLLVPVGYEQSAKKGLVILFLCQSCGAKVRNKALLDDQFQSDDYDAILALTPRA
ncbi:MAG: RNHCP domain-containing protein [Pseudobacteriovorax sp.]|nr:RNHCP domain-containing protein [Pseudobacteriovorax sp.]